MKHFLWALSLCIYTGLAFGELADIPTSEIDQAPPLPVAQGSEQGSSESSSALMADVARSALTEISAKTQRSSDAAADLSTFSTFCRERGC